MFLSFVDRLLVRQHLGDQAVASAQVNRLLEYRAIPDGMPVFLDEASMRPVEPLCSWFRHLAYEDKDAKTLREYAYIDNTLLREELDRTGQVIALDAHRARQYPAP